MPAPVSSSRPTTPLSTTPAESPRMSRVSVWVPTASAM